MVPSGQSTIIFDFLAVFFLFVRLVVVVVAAFLGSARARAMTRPATSTLTRTSTWNFGLWRPSSSSTDRIGSDWISLSLPLFLSGRQAGRQTARPSPGQVFFC